MARDIRIRSRVRMPVAERREQIIAVTTAIIAERGYWGLSLQDVADACELTVNGVLHHVGSKDALLVAVLDHRDAEDIVRLAEILDIDLPDRERSPSEMNRIADERGIGLARMCRAVMERNAGQPEIVRLYSVLGAESLSPDHPAHDYFEKRQRLVLAGFAGRTGRGNEGLALARHLLALMDGLQLQWLRDPEIDLLTAWDTVSGEVVGLS